jgi:zinc and cadmium transporter
MNVILLILLATIIDSLTALVGIFSLWLNDNALKKVLFILVAFSAGALLGGAFFHLIPESLGSLTPTGAFINVIIGFILFFIMERLLYWHHCHDGKCEVHPFGYLILIGDSVHNFIDGIIIGVGFVVNTQFGLLTTGLIIAHEIPQELGDFGVLVHGGFTKVKALLYNLIVQMTCIIGGFVGYVLSNSIASVVPFILPFAAGGFIYISASDLVPELHKEPDKRKSLVSFTFFIVGILLMLILKFLVPH